MSKGTGKVAQIIGPVVDVAFTNGVELPKIYDSLEVTNSDGTKLVLEVQSHIGESTVRTISMDSTDGLSRGVDAVATGSAIQMPVGNDIYGRLFNVIGDAIDGMENLPKTGDALDALVLCSSLPAGTVIEVIPIAVFKFLDNGETDYKILAIPKDNTLRTIQAKTLENLNTKYPKVKEIVALWFLNYNSKDTAQNLG